MERLIELPSYAREVEFERASFNEESRTIDVIWTTGATVRRRSWIDGPYDEELVVTPATVRLDRLNAGAPFLNSHDGYDLAGVIGAVVPKTARIEKGRGVATVQISRRDDVQGIVQDIRDGVIRNISVGYRVHGIEKLERKDKVPLWRVTDWEPMELSAVPIPADPGAHVRSEGGALVGADGKKLRLFPCVLTGDDVRSGPALARMRMSARELGLAV